MHIVDVLGEVLRGDRIVNTPFQVKMAENMGCSILCPKSDSGIELKAAESKMFSKFIKQEYNVHL